MIQASNRHTSEVELINKEQAIERLNTFDWSLEKADMFDHIHWLPDKVQSLLSRECESYEDCQQLNAELNELGYTMDYDLDAVGYNLREIRPTPEHYRDTLKAQGYGPTIGNHGLIFVHPPGGYKRSFVSYEEAVKHYRL